MMAAAKVASEAENKASASSHRFEAPSCRCHRKAAKSSVESALVSFIPGGMAPVVRKWPFTPQAKAAKQAVASKPVRIINRLCIVFNLFFWNSDGGENGDGFAGEQRCVGADGVRIGPDDGHFLADQLHPAHGAGHQVGLEFD